MTEEEFNKKLKNIPDAELIQMAKNELSSLCKTRCKSFTMSVPPKITDTDMVLSEIITRFENFFTL